MRFGVISTMLVVACGADNTYVPPVDDTGPTSDGCEPPLADVACGDLVQTAWPPRGANDGFYRGPWVLQLAADARQVAELFVAEEGGADLDGSWTWSDDGTQVWFRPVVPAAPGTVVRWAVGLGCCETERQRFTVSSVGARVSGPVVDGRTFAVDTTSGVTIAGGVVREALAAAGGRLLLRLGDWDAERVSFSLDLAGARQVGDAVVQDGCVPLSRLADDAVYDADPWFVAGASRLTTGRPGAALDWREVSLSAGVAPQATRIEGLELTGLVTAASLEAALGVVGPETVCVEPEPCVPCPTPGELCVPVHFAGLVGDRWASELEAVTSDVAQQRVTAGGCLD